MCSGSGAFIHSFDVADAGDAADGRNHALQLPLILDFQGHVYGGATVVLATGLGVVYVLLNDFQELAEKFILGIWPFYALAVGAVFRLRRTRPDLERPYRTWGYPLVPIVFLLASVAMLGNAVIESPGQTLFGFGVILVGIPVYFIWRAIKCRLPASY